MNIKPLNDNVVIKKFKEEKESTSGIVLPDNVKEDPQLGTVVAVGPGKLVEGSGYRDDMGVKEGDLVCYTKYAGSELEVDGEKYLILKIGEILVKLDND